jgi:hypothetical protein
MAQWPRYPSGGMIGMPWAHPGPHTLFEIGDDLVGDTGVNIGAVSKGLCHLRFSFEG